MVTLFQRMFRSFALCMIMLLAVPMAFAADEISVMSVPGATTVDSAKAKQLFDKKVPFIDLRNDKDWDAGRIPGAVHLDIKTKFNEKSLSKVAKKDGEVVVYCNGEKCLRSAEASEKAVKWCFTKVYYYRDGFPAWQAASYPVE